MLGVVAGGTKRGTKQVFGEGRKDLTRERISPGKDFARGGFGQVGFSCRRTRPVDVDVDVVLALRKAENGEGSET